MTRIIIPTICAVPVPLAAAAQALPSRIEVSGSAAATRVFRTEDQSFGTVINPGLGFEWRVWPRLGLGVQWSHATGLEPRVTTCASFPGASCTGIGRSGVLSATLVSATAAWYFEGNARARSRTSSVESASSLLDRSPA